MKSRSLSTTTLRVSRLLSSTSLLAGLLVFSGWAYDLGALRPAIAGLITAQTALCVCLLATAALLCSVERGWIRIRAQMMAAIAVATALEPLLRPWLPATESSLPALGKIFPAGMAEATSLACAAAGRQAEVGGARRFAGLGLGLAITRQLVEAHGGTISVDSGGRGQGAQFTVRMPPLEGALAAQPGAELDLATLSSGMSEAPHLPADRAGQRHRHARIEWI